MTLDPPECLFHLRAFRQARIGLLDDAEAYLPVFVCLENLGRRLYEGDKTSPGFVNELINPLGSFLTPSAYEVLVPNDRKNYIESMPKRFARARNDAVHSGAYARHLGVGCLEATLITEEALSQNMNTVSDFMVGSVVVAESWQPLSFARQIMLKNSFTWLPIFFGEKWQFLSAEDILKALGPSKGEDRAKILNTSIGELAGDNKIKLSLATQIQIKAPADDARAILSDKAEPLLVIDETNHLVGIVMAFDLL